MNLGDILFFLPLNDDSLKRRITTV